MSRHLVGLPLTGGLPVCPDEGSDGRPGPSGLAGLATVIRAGVEGVRLHDLRHFHASGLIASASDVVALQRALGHAKSTTLTTDAHLWPSAEDRVGDASARLLAEVLGSGSTEPGQPNLHQA